MERAIAIIAGASSGVAHLVGADYFAIVCSVIAVVLSLYSTHNSRQSRKEVRDLLRQQDREEVDLEHRQASAERALEGDDG